MNEDLVRVEIYLDGAEEPIGVYAPPASFELDTTKLPDGPHRLIIKATDRNGVQGIREVAFNVHNGPGIAVVGLSDGDVVEGKISVLVNAYAGGSEQQWEPVRAETPAPIPTWAWVLFMLIVAWAMWYWASQWTPSPQYANTPTFASVAAIASAGAPPQTAAGAKAQAKPNFEWAALGTRVYASRCAVCHLASGEGLPHFVPPLKASPMVTAENATAEIRVLLNGVPRTSGGEATQARWRGEMPPFSRQLSDAEIAAVINYERTNWGNNSPTVTPAEVRAVREQTPTR